MLTDIRLRNFKAFGDSLQNISLGKLNVFIGENGTGKSSALQALCLLGQSAGEEKLISLWSGFEFVDYHELVHTMQHDRAMAIGFGCDVRSGSPDSRAAHISYMATFDQLGRVAEQEGRIHVDVWPLLAPNSEWVSQFKYGDAMVAPPKIEVSGSSVDLRVGQRICVPFVTAGGAYQSGAENERKYKALEEEVSSLFVSFSQCAKNVFTVRAIRGFDRLRYSLGDAASDRLTRGDDVINTFAYRRDVEAKISAWLQKVTGVGIDVHLIPQKNAMLFSADGYNLYHEGFGTNQLVWPFLQLAIAPEGSLVAIEEPEIHLHPKAQTLLTDVLVDIALKEKKQLVMTTHSEHILMALLNLVTEEKLRPQDVSIYWFEKDMKTKAALATPLHVNGTGQLEEGLRGFFESSAEQLSRRLQLLSKKAAKR